MERQTLALNVVRSADYFKLEDGLVINNIALILSMVWTKASEWKLASAVACVVCLSACASSSASKLSLSDLGARYWQGTFYLSVEGLPSSIQCDIDIAYQNLDDVFVRYKGKDAEAIFDTDDDQIKIQALKQKCLDKSIAR